MSNCIICFGDLTEKRYTCCDPRCVEYLCEDCIKRYIEIASEENRLPTCPRDSCRGVFDEECIDKEIVPLFRKLLYNHYKVSKTTEINDAHRTKAVHNILKEEKMKFVFENMPKAVLKVSKIVHAAKLKRVKKSQLVREKGRVSRTCINLVCNGFLGDDFKCLKCETNFCRDCEDVLEDDHKCKTEDIESLKAVNAMVSCPSCGVKIEKGEGCMAITCAVCNQNFWYSTGEKGDHGNHGASAKVRVNFTRRITLEYREFIPDNCLVGIREIEMEAEIKDDSEQILANILIRNEGNEIKNTDLAIFSQKYSKIVRTHIIQTIALNKLKLLEKILQKCEEGYEKQIEMILNFNRPVIMAKIFGKDRKNNLIFIEEIEEFESLQSAAKKINLPENDLRKIIEVGDGVYENFYWYYK
jgi:hypothetical protein